METSEKVCLLLCFLSVKKKSKSILLFYTLYKQPSLQDPFWQVDLFLTAINNHSMFVQIMNR